MGHATGPGAALGWTGSLWSRTTLAQLEAEQEELASDPQDASRSCVRFARCLEEDVCEHTRPVCPGQKPPPGSQLVPVAEMSPKTWSGLGLSLLLPGVQVQQSGRCPLPQARGVALLSRAAKWVDVWGFI